MTISPDFQILAPLVGGLLVGGSAAALLLFNGQIAGISGVFGRFVVGDLGNALWRPAFLVGLLASGPVYLLFRDAPAFELSAGVYTLVVAGLLVGIGTRLGGGCTSGHGVCGLANLSPRSFAATLTFMAAAAATVFVVGHVL